MKIGLYSNEWYPYLFLGVPDKWNDEILDLTQEEIDWCAKRETEFKEFQNFLANKSSVWRDNY